MSLLLKYTESAVSNEALEMLVISYLTSYYYIIAGLSQVTQVGQCACAKLPSAHRLTQHARTHTCTHAHTQRIHTHMCALTQTYQDKGSAGHRIHTRVERERHDRSRIPQCLAIFILPTSVCFNSVAVDTNSPR